MVTTTFKVGRRKMQLRDQLQYLFSAVHDALNDFASNRLRHAAGAAEKLPSRRRSAPAGTSAQQLDGSNMQFVPLDPDVLSESNS